MTGYLGFDKGIELRTVVVNIGKTLLIRAQQDAEPQN
jgi:hypothetical protein